MKPIRPRPSPPLAGCAPARTSGRPRPLRARHSTFNARRFGSALLGAGLFIAWAVSPVAAQAQEVVPAPAVTPDSTPVAGVLTLTLEKALAQGLDANPGYRLNRQQEALSRV